MHTIITELQNPAPAKNADQSNIIRNAQNKISRNVQNFA